MSPKQRFAWWVGVVAVWAVAAPMRLGGFDAGWTIATALQTVAVVALFGLLATTPADAIKLPREVSWTVLVAGAWVNLVCAVTVLNNATLFAAVVMAVAVPVAVRTTVVRDGSSPWWVAVVAWSPALPALVARRVGHGSGVAVGWSWTLAGVGLVAAMILVWFQSRRASAPPGAEAGAGWKSSGGILGIATALSGIVPWLS